MRLQMRAFGKNGGKNYEQIMEMESVHLLFIGAIGIKQESSCDSWHSTNSCSKKLLLKSIK